MVNSDYKCTSPAGSRHRPGLSTGRGEGPVDTTWAEGPRPSGQTITLVIVLLVPFVSSSEGNDKHMRGVCFMPDALWTFTH